MASQENKVRYPLSANELEVLFHTIEWLTHHLREIITLLKDREGDKELLELAKSAHTHLETMLDHLKRHQESLGVMLDSGKVKKTLLGSNRA